MERSPERFSYACIRTQLVIHALLDATYISFFTCIYMVRNDRKNAHKRYQLCPIGGACTYLVGTL